jgi:hypothetical protein
MTRLLPSETPFQPEKDSADTNFGAILCRESFYFYNTTGIIAPEIPYLFILDRAQYKWCVAPFAQHDIVSFFSASGVRLSSPHNSMRDSMPSTETMIANKNSARECG